MYVTHTHSQRIANQETRDNWEKSEKPIRKKKDTSKSVKQDNILSIIDLRKLISKFLM